MQFHFVVEMRAGHEALQLRDAHLLHVLEDHVIGHGLDRGIDLRARKAQARHDFFGHLRAEFVVAAEADARSIRIEGEGGGLPMSWKSTEKTSGTETCAGSSPQHDRACG